MSDELPQGWAEAPLPAVAIQQKFSIVDGPFGSDLKLSDYVSDGTVPVLTTKNLTGTYDPSTVRFISAEKFEQLKRSKVVGGDILIAKIGSIGKCSIYPEDAPTAIIPANLCKISVNKEVADKRFVYWQIRTERFQNKLKDITSATAQPAFSVQRLKTLNMKIAPLPEQRRIVAKLETLLGKVDASQQRLAKIPVLLKRFRQSVLAAACSGRLTADWREGNVLEDAAILFERIRARRPARYQDASVRDDLDLPDIPETWSWTNLRFLLSPAEAFCYGVVQPGANDPDGAMLIRAGDLDAGRVNTSSLRRIPKGIHADYRRSQLLGGEILVTVVGAGIGETAIAQSECAGFNIARAVAKLPVREFNARYVHLWLQSGRAIDWMKGDSREVARPTLNLEQLQTLPVPVAPLPEQQEIVRRVAGLFALADQLEARLAKARSRVGGITPSLLARAFRGQLVPQDPTDEPAEKLLERIRSNRESKSHRDAR